MDKKGAELSITVIIVAILSLLVLVVLSYIFLGRSGAIQQDMTGCETKGGKCAAECGNSDYGTGGYGFTLPSSVAGCPKVNDVAQKCCSKSLMS